jgi:glutamine amidotransferase
MVIIIDYNLGNLKSIANMIRKIGFDCIISNRKEDIEHSSRIILPGVGSFDYGMKNLQDLCLVDIIKKKAIIDKIPILGICLGMQLLTKKSEEGSLPGLGLIEANTVKFNNEVALKVPHMGWNTIEPRRDSKLLDGMIEQENRYYFVHSYCVKCEDKQDVVATTQYGMEFVSIFEHENIMGVQFHPEKSHQFGMKLLINFLENY